MTRAEAYNNTHTKDQKDISGLGTITIRDVVNVDSYGFICTKERTKAANLRLYVNRKRRFVLKSCFE